MVDTDPAVIEAAIAAVLKRGGLARYPVVLEEGEWEMRSLWLRPEVRDLVISADKLEADQRLRVQATLRRFVIGGDMTVVCADSVHPEVSDLGDICELKFDPPPFIEMRFKPPKHHLRLFGRFIRRDGLVVTSFGMKSPDGKTGSKPLKVSEERRRCDVFFSACSLQLSWVPERITDSLSNATFA
jgi:hypothetical protein